MNFQKFINIVPIKIYLEYENVNNIFTKKINNIYIHTTLIH